MLLEMQIKMSRYHEQISTSGSRDKFPRRKFVIVKIK